MIKVIDLFAGCGGLSEGFLQTGEYLTLASLDWELPTVNTLRKRLAEKWGYDTDSGNFLHFDIQRTAELLEGYEDPVFGRSRGLNKIVGRKRVDLIIGGPPCQAYSMAGRVQDKNGMRCDYRNYLFESYVKLVERFRPTAFVFENVEGILSARPGDELIVDRIRQAFHQAGYAITSNLKEDALFDTSYYEVPQRRKRVIIFGFREDSGGIEKVQQFYQLMSARKTETEMPVESAFANLPKIYPLGSNSTKRESHSVRVNGTPLPSNHQPRFHNQRDIEIFKILADDIRSGRHEYLTVESLIRLYKEKTGRDSNFHKYNVLREDKPSNTIPAHLYKDGLRHIHPDPEQARSITVREAARIQTFDDDFKFLGAMGAQYKMIGNAVPPRFAGHIAKTVLEVM